MVGKSGGQVAQATSGDGVQKARLCARKLVLCRRAEGMRMAVEQKQGLQRFAFLSRTSPHPHARLCGLGPCALHALEHCALSFLRCGHCLVRSFDLGSGLVPLTQALVWLDLP